MSDEAVNSQKMPLLAHLVELRQRLLYSVIALFVVFIGCFAIKETLYDFMAQPLADILLARSTPGFERRMIFTDLIEPFFTYIKVSFFFAAFITCPVFLTQFWMFVAPGLYKNEKKALAPFLVASPVLFLIGASLVYFVILPFAWDFFISFETQGGDGTLPIQLEAKVNEYLSLTMKLVFAFGLCFQLPVVMTLLARVGIASSEGMRSKRKYAIVGVFIVAAVFTPPDPLSQISLAVPIVILYEISIIMARMVERKKAQAEAEAEAEVSD